MSSPLRLVVFDCDGTLIDSQHMIVAAMNHAFDAHGLETLPREQVLSIVGLSLEEAIHALVPHVEAPVRTRVTESYKGAFHELRARKDLAEPLFPGVREALDALSARGDTVLGIATGKSQRGVAAVLRHHGLEGRFVTIQTADDAPSKPHPGMVLQAMEATGARPEDTILIGDTSFDMVMARAAGARAVGVTWGYHARELLHRAGAERLIDDAGDLLPAMDELWGGALERL